MPVLTQKEYKNKSRDKSVDTPFILKEKSTDSSPPKKKEKEKIYSLMHPENPVGDLKNFVDYWMIKGVKKKVECINGVIKTSDKDLMEFLKQSQYIQLPNKEDYIDEQTRN